MEKYTLILLLRSLAYLVQRQADADQKKDSTVHNYETGRLLTDQLLKELEKLK